MSREDSFGKKFGNISLLTREYGRGTDFICKDDTVNLKGGIVVIQTFLS